MFVFCLEVVHLRARDNKSSFPRGDNWIFWSRTEKRPLNEWSWIKKGQPSNCPTRIPTLFNDAAQKTAPTLVQPQPQSTASSQRITSKRPSHLIVNLSQPVDIPMPQPPLSPCPSALVSLPAISSQRSNWSQQSLTFCARVGSPLSNTERLSPNSTLSKPLLKV